MLGSLACRSKKRNWAPHFNPHPLCEVYAGRVGLPENLPIEKDILDHVIGERDRGFSLPPSIAALRKIYS
jgi:hypothetical protein